MILSLRKQHRRIFIALGIFLPIALVTGIATRKAVPVAAEITRSPESSSLPTKGLSTNNEAAWNPPLKNH